MTFIKGQKAWNSGIKIDKEKYPKIGHHKKHSEETKTIISNKTKGHAPNKTSFKRGQNIGELNANYRGGVSILDRVIRRMPEYKQWRSDCFQRDNWTCQTCGIRGEFITVHHIKSFSSIIKENEIKNVLDARKCDVIWDINNGVTLCENCHSLTDNYKCRARKKLV